MRHGLLFTGAAALALLAGCTPDMQPTTAASDYAQFCADWNWLATICPTMLPRAPPSRAGVM